QGEEELRRHSLDPKSRLIPEPELLVVPRMPNQTTSSRIHLLQPRQPFLDERFANPMALVLRQHRHWPQAVPVSSSVRDGHRGEGDMPNHATIHFCDQRYGERLRRAQRGNYELLGVVADL